VVAAVNRDVSIAGDGRNAFRARTRRLGSSGAPTGLTGFEKFKCLGIRQSGGYMPNLEYEPAIGLDTRSPALDRSRWPLLAPPPTLLQWAGDLNSSIVIVVGAMSRMVTIIMLGVPLGY
jgi:hypothetical protein